MIRIALALLSVTLAAVSAAFAQSSPSGHRIITYPSDEGVALAQGWDIARSRETLSSCVVAETAVDLGEDKTLNFKRVVDTESMMRSLAVSVEAKASGIFGGSGSASANFSRSVSLATEDVNIT